MKNKRKKYADVATSRGLDKCQILISIKMTGSQIYTHKFQSEEFFHSLAFPSALCPTASILNKVLWDTSHLRAK